MGGKVSSGETPESQRDEVHNVPPWLQRPQGTKAAAWVACSTWWRHLGRADQLNWTTDGGSAGLSGLRGGHVRSAAPHPAVGFVVSSALADDDVPGFVLEAGRVLTCSTSLIVTACLILNTPYRSQCASIACLLHAMRSLITNTRVP